MTNVSDTVAIWGAWRARQSEATRTAGGFARMLSLCVDLDLPWIDHADIYDDGAVEALHGEACRELASNTRDRLKVISKCGVRFPSEGQPGVRVCHYRSDARFIREQAEASLARLGTERIDLYLLHRPDYLMDADETVQALEALVAAGKIAAYGASNFNTHQFERLASAANLPVAAHQIEFSPLCDTPLDDGTLDQAQRHKVSVLAWSPLGGGQLFQGKDARAQRVRERLLSIGERHGTSDIAGIALAWVRKPGNVIPILGTMNADRLARQVTGLRTIALDHQDWYDILEASRGSRVP